MKSYTKHVELMQARLILLLLPLTVHLLTILNHFLFTYSVHVSEHVQWDPVKTLKNG